MTNSEKANGVCGSTGFQKLSQNTVDFSDFALRRIGEKLTAYNRLEASARRFGISVYPLDGDSIYMTSAGGFHCCAPDLRAATALIRQLGAGRG
jgi:hypothetical protein